MEHINPLLDQSRLQETLIVVLDHVLPLYSDIQYRLVGTGAALLRGVDLPAGDIDITVIERPDVDAFPKAPISFKCLEPPAWLPEARQYYANYEVNDVL